MGEPALPPAPRWKGRGAKKAARASPMGEAMAKLRNAEHRIRALAVGSAALAHVDSQQLGALGNAAFGRLASSSSCCGCGLASCPIREDCLLAARVLPGPQPFGAPEDSKEAAPSSVRASSENLHAAQNRERVTGQGLEVGEHTGGQSGEAPQHGGEMHRAGELHSAGPSSEQRMEVAEASGSVEEERDQGGSEEPCGSVGAGGSSSLAGTGTRGCSAPVVHHDVHLSLEEAFFLQHALEALDVLGPCSTADEGCSTDEGCSKAQQQRHIPSQDEAWKEGPCGAAGEVTEGDMRPETSGAHSPASEGLSSASKADTDGVPQEGSQAETLRPLSHSELWSLGTQAHPRFGESCVGFWHMRAKNWVLRGGAQYGADFTAYQQHPNLVHSSYLVFVSRGHSPTRSSSSPALNEPNLSAQPQVPLPVQGQRVRQWVDFQAVVRVAASVAKRVLLLQVVEVPEVKNELHGDQAALVEGGFCSSVSIPMVGPYEVLEIEVHRWLAERGREARDNDC